MAKRLCKKRIVYRYEYDYNKRNIKLFTITIIRETSSSWILRCGSHGKSEVVSKDKYNYFGDTKIEAMQNLLSFWGWAIGNVQRDVVQKQLEVYNVMRVLAKHKEAERYIEAELMDMTEGVRELV